MTRFDYPALDETLYKKQLPNGLWVYVVPRPGFTKKLAYFVTDFGSIHTDFILDGKTVHAPAGIAHFLEHKMFDMPDGRDITAELAALGAGFNAFTSYDITAYYISCTDHFSQGLKLLLEFVSTPYFTPESVEKEMGIIDQEIGMNIDSPDSRIFENLMGAMYRSHPLRVPILGTSETIRQITPQLLHDCHRAFYTPANMVLCVVGDVDPHEVEQLALEVLGETYRAPGEKVKNWPESPETDGTSPHAYMEVSMPTFHLGFKCSDPGTGEAAIRQEFVGDLAAEALFGESSQLYLELYEQGLIDSSFGGGFETLDNAAMLLCSGDSDHPQAVRDAIFRRCETLLEEGISQEDFLRLKRSAMGRRIRGLDSFDSTCYRLCAYHLSHFDYFQFPGIYSDIRLSDLYDFLRQTIRPECCSLCVIEPLKEEN